MADYLLKDFELWVKTQGIFVDGVRPAVLPGKGIGIRATKSLKHGDRLIFVPTNALHTIKSTPFDGKQYKPYTVHSRLAAYLTYPPLDVLKALQPWRTTFPSPADIRASMPLLWPEEMQEYLPPPTKALLRKQSAKLDKDMEAKEMLLASTLGRLEEEDDNYKYNWLLVNSRCFYWDGDSKGKNVPRDNCMALCPFIDLFNHDIGGCSVTFNDEGFTVASDRDYHLGQEVTVSYGDHNNDFLLVEYGFTMAQNNADFVNIDHLILPKLSDEHRDNLEELNMYGDYVVDCGGACHRTQVALRLFIIPTKEWRFFVDGLDDGEREQRTVNNMCHKILQEFLFEAEQSIERVKKIKYSGYIDICTLIVKRWEQIIDVVTEATDRLRL